MFGFIADILTTVITVLFPIFASYKALRASDPAQLAPWLMYWTILSLLLLVESMFAFILTWIPFYSWIRFLIHFALVMPGSQGAMMIYQEHVEPFLAYHEDEIDHFISETHEKARAMGMEYFQQAIEWVKVSVLSMQPRPRTPPHSRNASQTYTQQLLSRFAMPSARSPQNGGQGGDAYSLLSHVLSGASTLYSGSHEAQAEQLSRSGTLIPDNLRTPEQRMSYVSDSRERLRVLLQAFDREAYNMTSDPSANLAKSRSEVDFDRIERDEASGGRTPNAPQGGWMPWNWNSRTTSSEGGPPPPYPTEGENVRERMPRGGSSRTDPDLAY